MNAQLALHTHNEKQVKRVKEATTALIDALNVMGMDEQNIEGMLQGVQGSHRTLQQSFFCALRGMIAKNAESHYDARNEGSVLWCKEVKDKTDGYMPFI